jgi:hypothetical protein
MDRLMPCSRVAGSLTTVTVLVWTVVGFGNGPCSIGPCSIGPWLMGVFRIGAMLVSTGFWITVVVGMVSGPVAQAVSRAMVRAVNGRIIGSDFMVVQCAATGLTGTSHAFARVHLRPSPFTLESVYARALGTRGAAQDRWLACGTDPKLLPILCARYTGS